MAGKYEVIELERCPVNHTERREMGLLGCYDCGVDIQSIEQANVIRASIGKRDRYGANRVLHSAAKVCPTCEGRGYIMEALP